MHSFYAKQANNTFGLWASIWPVWEAGQNILIIPLVLSLKPTTKVDPSEDHWWDSAASNYLILRRYYYFFFPLHPETCKSFQQRESAVRSAELFKLQAKPNEKKKPSAPLSESWIYVALMRSENHQLASNTCASSRRISGLLISPSEKRLRLEPRVRRPRGDGWRWSRSAVLQTRRSSITLRDQNAEFTHWPSKGRTSRDLGQTHSEQRQAPALCRLFALQLKRQCVFLLLGVFFATNCKKIYI